MKYTILTDSKNVTHDLEKFISLNKNFSLEQDNKGKTLITLQKPNNQSLASFNKEFFFQENELHSFLKNTDNNVISLIDDEPIYQFDNKVSYFDNLYNFVSSIVDSSTTLSTELQNNLLNTLKFQFLDVRSALTLHETNSNLSNEAILSLVEDRIQRKDFDNVSRLATVLDNHFSYVANSLSLNQEKIFDLKLDEGKIPNENILSNLVLGRMLFEDINIENFNNLPKDFLQFYLQRQFIEDFEGNLKDFENAVINIKTEALKNSFKNNLTLNNSSQFIYSIESFYDRLKEELGKVKGKTIDIPSKHYIEYGEGLKQSQILVEKLADSKFKNFVSLELIDKKTGNTDYLRLDDVYVKDLDNLVKLLRNDNQTFDLLEFGNSFATPITQDNLLVDRDGEIINFGNYKTGWILPNAYIDLDNDCFFYFKEDFSNSYYSDMANLIEWIGNQEEIIKIDTSELNGKSQIIVNKELIELPNTENSLPFNLFLIKHLKEKNQLPTTYKPENFELDQFNLIDSTDEVLKSELITYFASLNNKNFHITNMDNTIKFEVFSDKESDGFAVVSHKNSENNTFNDFFQTLLESKRESLKAKFDNVQLNDLGLNIQVRRFN